MYINVEVMASTATAAMSRVTPIHELKLRQAVGPRLGNVFTINGAPQLKAVMKGTSSLRLRRGDGILVARCMAESVEQRAAQALQEPRRMTKEEYETARAENRKQGLAQYEALKGELSQATVNVAVAITAYYFLVQSFEAAVSYGIGALASLGYLKLLCRHVDSISEVHVPEIFVPERRWKKRIGIRSDDVRKALQKSAQGSMLALSSPRLIIPIALFSLWALTSHFDASPIELQIAPLMLGFFAYKAAALLQAYEDNKDLLMDFPEPKGPEDL